YYKFFDGYAGEFAKFEEVTISEDDKTTIYYFDTGCHQGEMCSSGLPNEQLINIYGTSDWYVIDNGYLRDVVENPLDFGLCVGGVNCTNAYATFDDSILDVLPLGEDWDDSSDTYMYEIDYSAHALKGKLEMTEIYDSSGNLYARAINEWSVAELENSRYFPHLDQTMEFTFDGESAAREKATAYEYNEEYGLVISETNCGEIVANESTYEISDYLTDDDIYLEKSYAYDESSWIFKIASETISDNSGTVLAETEYYYDDSATLGNITEGLLTEEKHWLDTNDSWLNTEYDYNEYGNLTTETNPRGYVTAVAYDDYDFYPISITNALSQTIYFEINLITGEPASKTDLNGYTYIYTYDGLGRILDVQGPSTDGLSTIIHASYSYDDTSSLRSVIETKNDNTTNGLNTYIYVDGLDRKIQTRTEGEDSYIVTDTTYTDKGEIEQESFPYFSSGSAYTSPDSTQPQTSYEYDMLSRTTSATTSLGTTQTAYLPWTQTVTDPLLNMKTYYYDSRQNLVQVDETNEGATYSTYYEYNLLGNLTHIEDALGNLRNFEWDSLGRLTYQEEMHTPASTDYATWEYEYDENGNLTAQTFPAGEVATYSYDELDRIENDNDEIFYTYDTAVNGIGLPTEIIRGDYSVVYEYNSLGIPITETETMGSAIYTTETNLDILGRIESITYPDGSDVSYTYNGAGLEETVAGYITDTDYSPLGQIETIVYENGSTTENTYDSDQNYLLASKITTGYFSD
ncbi:MAG: virulence plasmid 65kDa B protein/YD repeat protein, partial [uncultured bacterium]